MELEHRYGPKVHLHADPYVLSLLARISAPETGTDIITSLVRSAYRHMFAQVLARAFPAETARVRTRMAEAGEPRAFYEGPRLSQETQLVVCSVIRAGILPAQTCYEMACEVLPPRNVRLDFLDLTRSTDESGHVTGIRLDGSNIGGPVADSVVLVPDPMGATGGTLERVSQIYGDLPGGPPAATIALHLIVTPEAIGRLTVSCPDLAIHAGRLDRGLSPPEVLDTIPGTHPDLERGLNDVQYIVPGAGGMGALLTNAWV
jgi:uracil phosphoribosyltransferase